MSDEDTGGGGGGGGGKMRREPSRSSRKPYDRPGVGPTFRQSAANTLNSLINYLTPNYFKNRSAAGGAVGGGRRDGAASSSVSNPPLAPASSAPFASAFTASAASSSSSAPGLHGLPSPIVGGLQSSLRNNNNNNADVSVNGFKPRSGDAHGFGISTAASLNPAAGAPLIIAGTPGRSLWSESGVGGHPHAHHGRGTAPGMAGGPLVSMAAPLSASTGASPSGSALNDRSLNSSSTHRSRLHNVNMSRPPSFNASLLSAPSILDESYKRSSFYPGRTTYGGSAARSTRKIIRRDASATPATASPVARRVLTPVETKGAASTSNGVVASATAIRILETLEKIAVPYGAGAASAGSKDDGAGKGESAAARAVDVTAASQSYSPSAFDARLFAAGKNPMGAATFAGAKSTPPPTKRLCTPITDASILKLPAQVPAASAAPRDATSTPTAVAPSVKPVFDIAGGANLTSTPLPSGGGGGGKMRTKRVLKGGFGSKRRLDDDEDQEEDLAPAPPLHDRIGLNPASLPKIDLTSVSARSVSPEISFDFAAPKPPSPLGHDPVSLPTTPEAFSFSPPADAKGEDGDERRSQVFKTSLSSASAGISCAPAVNFSSGSTSGLKTRSKPAPTTTSSTTTTNTFVAKTFKIGSVMDVLGPGATNPAKDDKKADSDEVLVLSSSDDDDDDEGAVDSDPVVETPPPPPKPKVSGFGDLFKTPTGSWECPTCMMRNAPDADKCPACSTAKPGGKTPDSKAAAAAAAKPAKPAIGFGDAFKPATGSWSCGVCMLSNKPEADKCVACQEARPGGKTTTTTTTTTFSLSKPEAKPVFDSKLLFPPKKSEGPKWTCDTCLVPNEADADSCVCCGTAKPRPLSSGGSAAKKKWTCDTCMVPNEAEKEICVCCGAGKPGAAKSCSAAPEAATSSGGPKINAAAFASSGPGFKLSTAGGAATDAGLKFGTSGGIKFGTAESSSSSSSSIKFGTAASTSSEGFKFGTAGSTPSSSEGFKFGAATSSTSSATTGGFKFGAPASSIAPTTAIKFGTSGPAGSGADSSDKTTTTSASTTGFVFGSSSKSESQAPTSDSKPTFVFGDSSKSSSTTNLAEKSASSASSNSTPSTKPTLRFGVSETSGTDAAKSSAPSFSFGASAGDATTKTTTPPLFQFGAKTTTTTTKPILAATSSSPSSFLTSTPTVSSSASAPTVSSAPSAADAAKPLFTFGAVTSKPSEAASAPSLFTFGSSSSTTTTTASSSFLGAGSSQPPTFSFSASGLKRSHKEGDDGDKEPGGKKAPGFQFSLPKTESSASSVPTFNFGAQNPAPKPVFTFGSGDATASTASSSKGAESNIGLFTFGAGTSSGAVGGKNASTPSNAMAFGPSTSASPFPTFGTPTPSTSVFATPSMTQGAAPAPVFGTGTVFGGAPAPMFGNAPGAAAPVFGNAVSTAPSTAFQPTPSFNFGAAAAPTGGLFTFGGQPVPPQQQQPAPQGGSPFVFGAGAAPAFGASNPFNVTASSGTPGRKVVKAVRKIKRKT